MNHKTLLHLEKKVNILHDSLIKRVKTSQLSHEVKKWVLSYINLLDSKYYIASNIDDILWFHKNGLSRKQKILDFGTGGGYIAYLIANITKKIVAYEYKGRWKDQHYTDNTYSSAFAFAYKVASEIEPSIQFKFYQKLPLEEKDESYDGIILYAVIEHLDGEIKGEVLKELYRILKPNGLLYIAKLPRKYSYQEFFSRKLNLNCHSDLYTKDKINTLLQKHSFKIMKIEQTGLFINTHSPITDLVFPIVSFFERILKFSPLNYFAHDYRLIAQKV